MSQTKCPSCGFDFDNQRGTGPEVLRGRLLYGNGPTGATDMFARLMGLKTISPDDLHRPVQNPGHVARRAKKLGYGNVHVMSAGISGWLAAKLPTESGD